jgi:hypothetical protein
METVENFDSGFVVGIPTEASRLGRVVSVGIFVYFGTYRAGRRFRDQRSVTSVSYCEDPMTDLTLAIPTVLSSRYLPICKIRMHSGSQIYV